MYKRDLKTGVEILAKSWFSKTGPSPNPPLQSPKIVIESNHQPASDHSENHHHTEKSPQEMKKDKNTRVDFSGVWKRDKCENIDAYVGAQVDFFLYNTSIYYQKISTYF